MIKYTAGEFKNFRGHCPLEEVEEEGNAFNLDLDSENVDADVDYDDADVDADDADKRWDQFFAGGSGYVPTGMLAKCHSFTRNQKNYPYVRKA